MCLIKGTVNVVLSDPLFKELNAQFVSEEH